MVVLLKTCRKFLESTVFFKRNHRRPHFEHGNTAHKSQIHSHYFVNKDSGIFEALLNYLCSFCRRNNVLTIVLKMRLPFVIIRKHCTTAPKSNHFQEEMKKNFIATTSFQKTLLSCGSAAIALLNPHRGDMIACLGEVTGEGAIKHMRKKMIETEEGAEILKEKPRINSGTVSFELLSQMPENTLGRVYADFMTDNNITADSRLPVQFIEDLELAYVMQRYREVHDLVHATLFMRTTMLGEVTVKWIEGIQTRLPMCISGGIWGAGRLKPKHRQLYLKYYLPWAIRTGNDARFLQGIYYEKRWDQDIDDFHKEMNIVRLVKK